MNAKKYINEKKLDLVTNWSYPADLLSYGEVAQLMEAYHKHKMKEVVSLLERAAGLVGNPGANISGSTDLACDRWQSDYELLTTNKEA